MNRDMEELKKKAFQIYLDSDNSNDPEGLDEDTKKILQELRVHQIELELQNEELKRSQEDLVRQRERYYQLFHNAPIGYALIDSNGLIRKVNHTLCRMLELNYDALNRPLSRYIHEEDRKLFFSRFRAFFKHPDDKSIEVRLNSSDMVHVEIRGSKEQSSMFNNREHEEEDFLFITVSDITERKIAGEAIIKAMEESKQVNEERNMFIANAGHELRTPLNSIIGFAHIMLEQKFGPLNDKQRRYMENISSNGTHLLEMINDLLDFSKSQAGKVSLEPELINLKLIFHEVYNIIYPLALNKNIHVIFEDNEIQAVADAPKLKQILVNLVSNAVKFTPENGNILVRATMHKNELVIGVKDDGIGISEKEQKRIFEPFTQIRSYLSEKNKGTGLGLSLVKSYIKLHGGDIELTSRPGEGSTFTIRIPQNQ